MAYWILIVVGMNANNIGGLDLTVDSTMLTSQAKCVALKNKILREFKGKYQNIDATCQKRQVLK